MSPNNHTEGRCLTPDPLGGDISNPQTLNRYAYVLNSPVTLTDPSGLLGVKIYAPGCDPALCIGGGGWGESR